MTASQFRCLIIIPTYNEVQNIRPLIDTIQALPLVTAPHILIVDDHSPDGTGLLADQMANEKKNIFVLHRNRKEGLGKAYLDGFAWGLERGYSWLIEMDADHSHAPIHLKEFEKGILSGSCEWIIGSRYISGGGVSDWNFVRRLISRMGNAYASLLLRCPIRDLTGGFNAWKGEVLQAIHLNVIVSEGYAFQVELKYRAFKKGFRYQEIPIVFVDRKSGESKFGPSIMIEAFRNVLKLRRMKV